jgi:hypothetical protein
MQVGHGGHDATDLGQALQPADRRIARECRLADIVEQLVTVVGAERDAPAWVASVASPALLLQQRRDRRSW